MSEMTIYDISRLAGVSITTVSRVLNGNGNVNAETRKRVEKTIKQYKYIPKQMARNHPNKDLYAVGLMMDDIRHAYMSELAFVINQELGKWKTNTVLCNITDVEKEFVNQVDNLIEKRVNGVILMGSIFKNNICRLAIERRYSDFPFVSINGNFAIQNVHEIIQDQFQGTKDAVNYLIKIGRRRIGWIFVNKSNSDQKKYAGFIAGIEACKNAEKRLVETDEKTLDAGIKATEKLLDEYPDTDAIIYSADILAIGGIHCLNEQGISIPDQIAIIGYNNSSLAKECYPPLTSIDNRISDCGRLAAEMITNVLNGQTVENIVLPCGLAIRESTERTPKF